MTVHVKQSGLQKEVTGIYVKLSGLQREVLEGWVKQGGLVKQFYSVAPVQLMSPLFWGGNLSGGAPYSEEEIFTYSGAGPFTWSQNVVSATGNAQLTLISGQGTSSATYRVTCASAGELTGTVICNGSSANVNFLFDGGL